ncbi:MAG: hypothetical protein Q7K40_00140 [bacterium]|nr:hypothetical protein [bacterium]
MKKVTALLLAVVFACTTLFTTATYASEVNTSLAANPTATLSEIDAMQLMPLSDEKAGEVRGENWVVVMGVWTLVSVTYMYYKWITDPQWVTSSPSLIIFAREIGLPV